MITNGSHELFCGIIDNAGLPGNTRVSVDRKVCAFKSAFFDVKNAYADEASESFILSITVEINNGSAYDNGWWRYVIISIP